MGNEHKVEEGEEELHEKSQKEIDEEIKKKKERQIFLDDVGVLVSMLSITILAIIVVVVKIVMFEPETDPTVSTFRPLDQEKTSQIKYTGNGFIPCRGIVPCPDDKED